MHGQENIKNTNLFDPKFNMFFKDLKYFSDRLEKSQYSFHGPLEVVRDNLEETRCFLPLQHAWFLRVRTLCIMKEQNWILGCLDTLQM